MDDEKQEVTTTVDTDDGDKGFEQRMETTLAGMADKVDGMEERLKTQYGTDLQAAQDEMDEKQTKLDGRLTDALAQLTKPGNSGDDEPDEFYGYGEDGFGDYMTDVLAAARTGQKPGERLVKMQAGEIEKRRLDTLSGADGGWFMPAQWSSQFLRIPDDSQYIKSLCKMVPAGTPPNAELKILALDQTGTKGISGGVSVFSAVEAASVTVSPTAKLKVVSLKPEKIGAYYQLTEELRVNAAAMAGLMGPLFQQAIAAYDDDKIQTGTGAGEFLGFDGCSAEISVARSVASQINYIDLVEMMARILTRGNYVWLCQRVDILPQLMTLTDGAGHLIWTDNARDGIPAPRLNGVPIFFSEISPALGSAGDLRLINLDYYLIKPGMVGGLESDKTYSNFLAGIETLRFIYYADGKPWLTDALTLRDGTNTVSPFVSLAA